MFDGDLISHLACPVLRTALGHNVSTRKKAAGGRKKLSERRFNGFDNPADKSPVFYPSVNSRPPKSWRAAIPSTRAKLGKDVWARRTAVHQSCSECDIGMVSIFETPLQQTYWRVTAAWACVLRGTRGNERHGRNVFGDGAARCGRPLGGVESAAANVAVGSTPVIG